MINVLSHQWILYLLALSFIQNIYSIILPHQIPCLTPLVTFDRLEWIPRSQRVFYSSEYTYSREVFFRRFKHLTILRAEYWRRRCWKLFEFKIYDIKFRNLIPWLYWHYWYGVKTSPASEKDMLVIWFKNNTNRRENNADLWLKPTPNAEIDMLVIWCKDITYRSERHAGLNLEHPGSTEYRIF